MREEGELLEEQADRAVLGGEIDALLGVEPHLVAQRDAPRGRALEAGDGAQHARLAGPRGADQGERLGAYPESDLEVEAPSRKMEVESELRRVHEGTSLTARSRAALKAMSRAPMANAVSKLTLSWA